MNYMEPQRAMVPAFELVGGVGRVCISCRHALDNVVTLPSFQFNHVVPRVFRATAGPGLMRKPGKEELPGMSGPGSRGHEATSGHGSASIGGDSGAA